MPAKKINKSAFIRSLPAGITAADAMKLGAKKGVRFNDKFFYNVRAKAKTKGPSKSPGRPKGSKNRKANGHSDFMTVQQFTDAVLELGVGRARTLLDEVVAAAKGLV